MATAVHGPSPSANAFVAFMEWTPDRIRRLRLRLDKTQAEFATMLGYTRHQTVSALEKGDMNPSGAVEILLDVLDTHGRIPIEQEQGKRDPD